MVKCMIYTFLFAFYFQAHAGSNLLELTRSLSGAYGFFWGSEKSNESYEHKNLLVQYLQNFGLDNKHVSIYDFDVRNKSQLIGVGIGGIWINNELLATLPDAQKKFILAQTAARYSLIYQVVEPVSHMSIAAACYTPIIALNTWTLSKIAHNKNMSNVSCFTIATALFLAHKCLVPIIDKHFVQTISQKVDALLEKKSVQCAARMLATTGSAWIIEEYLDALKRAIEIGKGKEYCVGCRESYINVYTELNTFWLTWKQSMQYAEDTVVLRN